MQKKISFEQHRRFGIGYVEYTKPQAMNSAHYHDTYEIYFQTKGSRIIIIENERVLLNPGDIAVIEPYTMHITESTGDEVSARFVINIFMPLLNSFLDENELNRISAALKTGIIHTNGRTFERAFNISQNIFEYYLRKDIYAKKLLKCSLYELLDLFARSDMNKIQTNIAGGNTAVLKALQYVHSHYSSNISLDFISEYVNMSKSNFCLVFNKTIGETFISYLNHVRISHVHRLLLETDMSVNKIAEKTGFSTTSYMISLFTKMNNVSPGKLRSALK